MNAINFVVRTNAGAVERGVVGAEDLGYLIDASNGREISLNIHRSDLRSYDRAENDLHVLLADGRVIVLEDYFGRDGNSRLFLSTDGVLSEVAFAQGDGGALFAQYADVAALGKWSPDDALVFFDRADVVAADYVAAEDEGGVTMLAAGLLAGGGMLPWLAGGAAVATGAAVIGGSGDGGGDGTGGGGLIGNEGEGGGPRAPTVNDGEYVIGGDGLTEEDRTVLVSGTANEGDTVVVVIGDNTETTTTGSDGTWEVVFEGPNFPPDGEYEVDVKVTGTDGETDLDGPTVIIDTTPPPVAITSGTTAFGDIITDSEFDGGTTVTGTTEIGATVVLIAGGVSHVADVDAAGNWSVTLTSSTFERGEYIENITVIATDSFNNSTTINDGIEIDTVSGVTINTTTIETDGIINAQERTDGVQITGTTDAGSTVLVEMNGYTRTAFVDAQGNWTVTFTATEIPVGEQNLTINATATDEVGNTSSATGQVVLDTWVRNFDITSQAGGADGIVNAEEAMQGMTVTGTTEPGASVSVALGGGASRNASVDANGNWTVTFSANELPSGEQTVILTASSTDLAGNTATETRNVVFDTDAGLLTISPEPIEGDDVINHVEASDGVVITGTSTPFQAVEVTLDGVTKTVQTDGFGIWRANYAAGEIRPGEYEAQITAYIVDAAGNELTRTDTVMVDTFVRNFAVSANPVTADNIVNDVEQAQGVTLSGTTEPGATVTVVVEGVSRAASVDAAGNWTARFSGLDLPDGTYTTTAQISTQDRAGNTATTSKTFQVDTEVLPLTSTSRPGGADGVLNEAEAAQGFTLTGQVEQGATVEVTIAGQRMTAQVSGSTWSVAVPTSVIPTADGDTVSIQIAATDRAGNTKSITETMVVDNVAPDAPDMTAVTWDQSQAPRGIMLETTDHNVSIVRVGAGGVQTVGFNEQDNSFTGETSYTFNNVVPDGSHLVVTATDSAGNSTGTYVVLGDPDVSRSNVSLASNIGGREIDVIDLEFTEEATLTITEAQIVALTGEDNTVRVLGNSDETVRITGATRTGSRFEDGTNFNVYELGDATVLIDDDINNVSI